MGRVGGALIRETVERERERERERESEREREREDPHAGLDCA